MELQSQLSKQKRSASGSSRIRISAGGMIKRSGTANVDIEIPAVPMTIVDNRYG